MADLRRNIRRVYKGLEPFWGKYTVLNDAKVPDIPMIQQFQLDRIQHFQKAMSDRVEGEDAKLNALFLNGQINSLPTKVKDGEEKRLDKAIEEIVKALNSTYDANKTKKKNNGEYNYQKMARSLNWLQSCLEDLNKVIIANNGKGIPKKYITRLKEGINACQMSSLDSGFLDQWFNDLNNIKGDLVEDIGVAWLSALDIPTIDSITTINTGSISYQGSGDSSIADKYGRRGQLIQDLMTLKVSGADLKKHTIQYRPVGSKQVVTKTLEEFFADLDKANNDKGKQIVLYDSGYETLLNLSALNIQAKAGINQLPWNEGTKSTQVSIGEFADDDNLIVSARHTFELLHELDQETQPEKDIWVEDPSPDYNLMANYGLATVLFKILHLEENGNDYVLTPLGFTTFTDRIKYLIEKKESYVNIKEQVTINDNTLGEPYNVSMVGYNR